MVRLPSVKGVESEGDYIHVRFRQPSEFDDIRTPDWAQNLASEVSTGSKVRMGHRKESDSWAVQSVLIKKSVGKSKAREQAKSVLKKIEADEE